MVPGIVTYSSLCDLTKFGNLEPTSSGEPFVGIDGVGRRVAHGPRQVFSLWHSSGRYDITPPVHLISDLGWTWVPLNKNEGIVKQHFS